MGEEQTTTPAMIERSADNNAIYRHIRSEIRFEIDIMHARVNWLIAS